MTKLSRRNFLLGAGAAGMAMAMSAAGVAYAADKKDEEDTDWASQVTEEISCDILVVGGGFSGTAAAVQAGENGDKVLLIDDFLANGKALEGLAALVRDSGAELVGAGIVIEKGFQVGGDLLRSEGIRLESLAIVESMDEEAQTIVFRDDE